ncbi:MAG: hypothetical protein H8E91_07955 [Planctomycetes bacterium]|nr:hypothetical protein [Planctomycetota bacterium]
MSLLDRDDVTGSKRGSNGDITRETQASSGERVRASTEWLGCNLSQGA